MAVGGTESTVLVTELQSIYNMLALLDVSTSLVLVFSQI